MKRRRFSALELPHSAQVALGGAGGAAAKVLNPDIAVIGDFLGAAGNGAGRPTPSLEMHESEVAFQAILDPYARADFVRKGAKWVLFDPYTEEVYKLDDQQKASKFAVHMSRSQESWRSRPRRFTS